MYHSMHIHVNVRVHVCILILVVQVVGKIGTVVGISESGDLKIRYPDNLIYTLCPEAVVKVA